MENEKGRYHGGARPGAVLITNPITMDYRFEFSKVNEFNYRENKVSSSIDGRWVGMVVGVLVAVGGVTGMAIGSFWVGKD